MTMNWPRRALALGALLTLIVTGVELAPAAARPPAHAPAHGYRRKQAEVRRDRRKIRHYRQELRRDREALRRARARREARLNRTSPRRSAVRRNWGRVTTDSNRYRRVNRYRRTRLLSQYQPRTRDVDRDGTPDFRDRDIDGDGVRNSRDRSDYNPNRR